MRINIKFLRKNQVLKNPYLKANNPCLRIDNFRVHVDVQVIAAVVGETESNSGGRCVRGRSDDHLELGLKHAQLPETRTVPHHHAGYGLLDLGGIHDDRRNEVEEDVVAICSFRLWMREGHLQFVHGF